MKRAGAAAAALSFCVLTPAFAQDTETPATTPSEAGPTVGYYDDGNWIPPSRGRAPETDHCPQATWPPEPVSTSERAASSPTPLSVRYHGPCGVTAASGYTVPDGVVASAWLVADLDTGEVVAMKDPHGCYRPASIIKVLLALTVINELPLNQQVPVSAESAGQEGSAAGIGEGGDYTVEDLLTGLLLSSGNDCAHALAQALGGDELTLGKINALAQRLGMHDTRATSYSGLDSAGIGGKTGYTDDANHTFVGAVDHEGRRLLAVVLDTAAYDHRAWEQAQMLLHEAYGVRSSVAKLEPLAAPAAPTTAKAAPTPTPVAGEETAWDRWQSYAVVAGVLVLAAGAATISLATAAKRRRRR